MVRFRMSIFKNDHVFPCRLFSPMSHVEFKKNKHNIVVFILGVHNPYYKNQVATGWRISYVCSIDDFGGEIIIDARTIIHINSVSTYRDVMNVGLWKGLWETIPISTVIHIHVINLRNNRIPCKCHG